MDECPGLAARPRARGPGALLGRFRLDGPGATGRPGRTCDLPDHVPRAAPGPVRGRRRPRRGRRPVVRRCSSGPMRPGPAGTGPDPARRRPRTTCRRGRGRRWRFAGATTTSSTSKTARRSGGGRRRRMCSSRPSPTGERSSASTRTTSAGLRRARRRAGSRGAGRARAAASGGCSGAGSKGAVRPSAIATPQEDVPDLPGQRPPALEGVGVVHDVDPGEVAHDPGGDAAVLGHDLVGDVVPRPLGRELLRACRRRSRPPCPGMSPARWRSRMRSVVPSRSSCSKMKA